MKIAQQSQPAASRLGKPVGVQTFGLTGGMRTVSLGERPQQFLLTVTLSRELLADPLDVSLLCVAFRHLPVGMRQCCRSGLQETQI
jgi:hypothetical protein